MQDRKTFTQEELQILRNNPYVKNATENTIHFTVAFKEEFWRLFSEEKLSPQRIIGRLGFDVRILGESRIKGIKYQLQKQVNKGEPFSDVRRIPEKKPLVNFEHTLTSKPLQKIAHRLAYLEQEMVFIKKNIMVENEARRKKC